MIYPTGTEKVADSAPLEVSAAKKTAMIKKAKEFLTTPMENKELMDALENYYVFEKNEHYTSAQLKEVVDAVAVELKPVEEVVEPEILTK